MSTIVKKRAFLVVFIVVAWQPISACAEDGQQPNLRKAQPDEVAYLGQQAQSAISPDLTAGFVPTVDTSQIFILSSGKTPKLRLVPVTYNSKQARNDVCLLFVFSPSNRLLETLRLHYVQGDRDEIVQSCVAVQSVALMRQSSGNVLIYILRYRLANHYGDSVYVASLRNSSVKYAPHLTRCLTLGRENWTISAAKSVLKRCQGKAISD